VPWGQIAIGLWAVATATFVPVLLIPDDQMPLILQYGALLVLAGAVTTTGIWAIRAEFAKANSGVIVAHSAGRNVPPGDLVALADSAYDYARNDLIDQLANAPLSGRHHSLTAMRPDAQIIDLAEYRQAQ
jgi:hypothetical protein